MATYYLINATRIGTRLIWPGTLIDSAQENTAAIQAAGGRLYASANATVAAAAVVAQRIKQTGGSLDDAQAGMVAAASKADADSTDVATVANATATNVAEARSGHVRITAPATAALTGLVNTADVANGALTIAAQPDVPRKLQIRIVDANSSISAGTLTLSGTGPSGEALPDQVINLAGGTRTITTDRAYATFSGTVAGLAGAATGDTLGIGPASALGLPGQKTPASSSFAVHKASVDNVDEAVGTVDAPAGTIVPTTAPNGTRNFNFWFTYAVTVVQNAHTHTATLS